MITLFALTGFWLWFYLGASLLWMFVWAYQDRYWLCTTDLLVLAVLMSVTGNFPIVHAGQYLQAHPGTIFGAIFGYLFLGMVWATLKWKLFLRKVREKWDRWRSSGDQLLQLELSRVDLVENVRQGETPKVVVSKYKSRITGWIGYWPVSLVLWLIGDFLRDVADACYRMVSGFFQRMADKAFD